MDYQTEDRIDVLHSEEEVTRRIKELGEQISKDYAGKSLHMICVLRGGVYFLTELSKHISIPVTLDFMAVSSYGNDTHSSGNIIMKKDLDEPVEGRDVLVVEDIIDTGRTLSNLMALLKERKPASVRLCTLLDKPSGRVTDIEADYTGFVIPDAFVVGYGLDYAQKYRNLPYIGIVRL